MPATSSARDLGGWHEHAGEIEVARLIVGERDIALVSAAQGTLLEIATHLEASFRGLIAPQRARRVSCQEVPLPALLSHFA